MITRRFGTAQDPIQLTRRTDGAIATALDRDVQLVLLSALGNYAKVSSTWLRMERPVVVRFSLLPPRPDEWILAASILVQLLVGCFVRLLHLGFDGDAGFLGCRGYALLSGQRRTIRRLLDALSGGDPSDLGLQIYRLWHQPPPRTTFLRVFMAALWI
jgi:hypothetical protein